MAATRPRPCPPPSSSLDGFAVALLSSLLILAQKRHDISHLSHALCLTPPALLPWGCYLHPLRIVHPLASHWQRQQTKMPSAMRCAPCPVGCCHFHPSTSHRCDLGMGSASLASWPNQRGYNERKASHRGCNGHRRCPSSWVAMPVWECIGIVFSVYHEALLS